MDYYINLSHTPNPSLPPRGSFLYYCYRKLPKEKQIQLMVIESLQHQIIKTCELYKEPMVALKKLKWWIEESNNAFNGKPNHPLMIALMKVAKEYKLPNKPLIDMLSFKTEIIRGKTILTTEELNLFIQKQYNYFEVIRSYILHGHLNLNSSTLTWLGSASEIMETIRYIYLLLWHKNHNLYLLPEINSSPKDEKQKEILNNISLNLTVKADKLIQRPPSKTLNPTLNRLKLHLKILKIIKKNKFNVEQIRIELTPLQMLFTTK